MPDIKTNAQHFFTTGGYIFSKYVHFDMQFIVEKNSPLLCFQDGFGITIPVFSY